jgi:hypothetical protein
LAAVYGIKPWELEHLTFGELETFVSELPAIVRRLGQVEHVTYQG